MSRDDIILILMEQYENYLENLEDNELEKIYKSNSFDLE